jgi:hypothetical protein
LKIYLATIWQKHNPAKTQSGNPALDPREPRQRSTGGVRAFPHLVRLHAGALRPDPAAAAADSASGHRVHLQLHVHGQVPATV